jgi:hypothetical protein
VAVVGEVMKRIELVNAAGLEAEVIRIAIKGLTACDAL